MKSKTLEVQKKIQENIFITLKQEGFLNTQKVQTIKEEIKIFKLLFTHKKP